MVFNFVSLVTLVAAAGQSSAGSIETDGCAIWGQVITPGRSPQEPTFLELVGKDGVPSQRVQVIDGNYRFTFVPPNQYQFRVSDQSGRVVYKETKTVRGTDDHIVIGAAQARSGRSGTPLISLAELKHKVPRTARDEYNFAGKAAEDGKLRASVEHFLKALEIDPQFPEARINLAVQYSRMGRNQEALQESRRAFELYPENLDVGYRYAMLLLTAKNYRECETIARYVIKNQWYAAQMKAALAISLIGQRRNIPEAFDYLQQAATEFPLARLLVAKALVEIGWRELAVNQVRIYLNSAAHPCERARLEAWIGAYGQPADSGGQGAFEESR